MEQEILEELKKIYKDCKIDVQFIDFRKYKINVDFELNGYITKHIEIIYDYNVNFTKDYNISIILYRIDKQIINAFKREVINE